MEFYACTERKDSRPPHAASVQSNTCSLVVNSKPPIAESGVLFLAAVQVAMAKNRPPLPPVDPDSCPHELATLLDDCFSFNPRERPSSGEVMKLMAHMMRTHLPEIS
jgi:hypothetical protein